MPTIYGPNGEELSTDTDRPPPDREPEAADATLQEVAYAQKEDLARGFVGELRQPDDRILDRRPGQFLEAYERLRSDSQVKPTLQQRRTSLVQRDIVVEPGADDAPSRRAADWTREMIDHVGWDRVASKMHYGVFYGYAVAELMYEQDGSTIGVDQVKVRDRSRFRFDRDFRLRLTTPTDRHSGELMPARKFWVYTSGADHDDQIYGLGLAHFLYWPVYFKRNGVRIWLNTLEAAARGAPYGTYPPGAPKHEQNKLLRALSILRDGGSAIWPEGMDVGTLDIDRSGAPSNGELHDKMNAAISKIVLSQTLTTDAEAGGGLGGSQAEVQQGVAEQVQKADAMLMMGSFRRGQPNHEGPLEWLVEWNFPEATIPNVHYDFHEADDLKDVADRVRKMYLSGWKVSEESVEEAFPLNYEALPETQGGGAAGRAAELAEGKKETALPAPTAVADAVQDSADEELAGMVEEVRGLLKEVGSLQEFSRRLIELYPELPNEQLTEILGNGMLSVHALGRAQIQEEAGGVSQEES